MANHWNPLKAVDQSLKAFFDAAAITGLAAVVRGKETSDKDTFPILICASESASRLRHKNWQVSGSLILKTNLTVAAGSEAATLVESDEIEADVLDLLESPVPDNDLPQPLAAAIQAAAVAAAVADADKFLIVDFMVKTLSAGFDDDGNWTFTVDYTAIVALAQ